MYYLKMFLQDGVAPQCASQDLIGINGQINTGNGKQIKAGRVFIPDNPAVNATKGYLGSHSISNYGWIFTNQTKDDPGYVRPRN